MSNFIQDAERHEERKILIALAFGLDADDPACVDAVYKMNECDRNDIVRASREYVPLMQRLSMKRSAP